ncbi:MAG: DEAD/DEAH box helicase [Myxococcaceae bacterium]
MTTTRTATAAITSAAQPSPGEGEAFLELRTMARGKAGSLSPDLLARHVLSSTSGGDFPVQRAAMEALLRRFASVKRDGLRIRSRPAGGPLGFYRTHREGARSLPYQTLLSSLEPLSGSCDCRDYARSSLGLCKHLFAILEDLTSHPRRSRGRPGAEPLALPLRWDPVRPLVGEGDWLARVSFVDVPARRGPSSLAVMAARRHFEPGQGPARPLRAVSLGPGRLRLVRDLLKLVEAGARSDAPLAEPALAPLLKAEADRLERSPGDGGAARELPRLLKGLKLKLYPYQLEGVGRFLQTGRLLLADDMGLGKTAQAIASCHALLTSGRVTRGLLVVPAALKPQWLREWKQFSDAPVAIVEGNPSERAKAYRDCKRGFLLANYEQVLRDLPLMHRFRPELVVLDEAQRIKNWAAKTSAYVKQLSPRYRLVLTGTPMENRIEELASLVEWVDDLALEPKWRLSPWHATFCDGRREVSGARNLDTLRTRLSGCMLRRVRKEVLTQLPSRTDTRVPVPITPEQLAEHDERKEPIARLMATARKRPLRQAEFLTLMSLMTQQRIICNGLAQLNFEETWPSLAASRPSEARLQGLFSPKLLELRELIANVAVQQQRKVVVFSQWRRMLKLASWAVSDLLEAAGARAVFFTGEEGQRRRTQNLVDFHDDPAARVLFASDAGGVGLNLQRAASCCINLELPWNPAVLEQRVGRIYRLGQSRPVEVYHLVSDQGIEARIEGLVGNKKALFTGLFEGKSDEVQFEHSGSFLSRIERVLEPVQVPKLPSVEEEAEDEAAAADSQVDVSDAVTPTLPAPPAPVVQPGGSGDLVIAAQLQSLFSRVEVRPAGPGRVTIEAPIEAAAALAALFQGAAKMLSPAG